MDEIRAISSTLATAENANFARFDTERTAELKRVLSVTVITNSVLFVLAVCLFSLTGQHGDTALRRSLLGAEMP